MDLKKVQTLEKLNPQPLDKKNSNIGGGPSFQETLSQVGIGSATTPAKPKAPAGLGKVSPLAGLEDGIRFSNHAIDRMRSRGISFNAEDRVRLTDAVNRAASKGAKDSLILMNDSALIVSVKNKTVVTVMDKTALKENVFTNIDSTIVM